MQSLAWVRWILNALIIFLFQVQNHCFIYVVYPWRPNFLPQNYSPYNITYDLAFLKADMNFLNIRHSLKQQQNMNKLFVSLISHIANNTEA